ncbi:GNAT family N-acetyltransferase [Halovivax sp.]|uniref:GNAT family N-acetyltransferase n=1 Tax=Halovivax sp. TaxID=1935978 RepID=UPI0025C18B3E|nr:GNAT family N-acetyltransferase [Halovivax sp.]
MTSESVTATEVGEWIRADHLSVAHSGDDVVGGIRLQRTDPHRAKVGRLGVHEAWKGNGIGTRLMRHAEDLADRRGCDVVWLTTPKKHPFLPDWYRRLGYEDAGPNPQELWEYESIRLEKRLEGTNAHAVAASSGDQDRARSARADAGDAHMRSIQ